MEAKVKMLLDSENSDGFIVGVYLAKSVLGWTGLDILEYKNSNTLLKMETKHKK